jgi:Tfp pilus assembly PilM family ATPase
MVMIDQKDSVEDARDAGLLCPQCEAANLPQRRFCAKCGATLWEACLRCGEVCAAGELYCGACGVNLADAAAEKIERVQDDFRAAADMRSAHRFADAIALITPAARNRHPRMARYTAHAEQLLRQLAAERDRHRTATEEAFRQVGEHFAAFDYDEAARILDRLAPSCRNENIEQLQMQIAQRREEIATIDRELRAAAQEKRLLDLPPKIERLLTLKPDHPYANKLDEQVRSRLIDAAEKRMADYRYDDALQLLDRVTRNCGSPRLEQLRRQAAELAWLNFDLRNTPTIDATLVAVAKRLRQLTPGDVRAAKLCDEVQRRAAQADAQATSTAIAWARPPRETSLGVAVEGLAAFRRIACDKPAAGASELTQSPGRFAVACGLALAGLKRAALQVNLMAGENRGILDRASRMIRAHGKRPAWGLDLGMSGLRAVKLSWNQAAGQAAVEAAVSIEHAKSLANALNEADEQKLIADTLSKFLELHRPKGERICAGLPGRMALMRQFELPPVEQGKIPKLLEFEARQQFPFPLEQLLWDCQFLDEAGADAKGPRNRLGKRWRNVLLIGSQAVSSRRFLDAFRRQNITIDMLQTDFLALHNFLAHEYLSDADACPTVAALDVGCDVTNLVVSSPQSLWFRSCGIAGHSFTRALVKEFKLSVAQAEQRKRTPESSERFSDLYEAMSPVFEDLLKELQQSLAAYSAAQPDRPIQRVLGLGGGFSLHGLLRCLWYGR